MTPALRTATFAAMLAGGMAGLGYASVIRRRRARSMVTAVLLVGMVLLFYFITIARIGG